MTPAAALANLSGSLKWIDGDTTSTLLMRLVEAAATTKVRGRGSEVIWPH